MNENAEQKNIGFKMAKNIISMIISVAAIVISICSCNQSISSDLYNRKVGNYSYSYDFINNDEENYHKESKIEFYNRDNILDKIRVEKPTQIVTKINSGMPQKRQIVFTGKSEEELNIINIKTIYSSDGVKNINPEDLIIFLKTNKIPAYKIDDNQYISYYFIINYGIDGSKNMDCIWYQIFSEHQQKQAFAGIMDSLELELKYLSVSKDNLRVDYDLLNQFYIEEICHNYRLLKDYIKEAS